MTKQERLLTVAVVGGPVLAGVIYLAYLHLFTLPEYDQKIEALSADIQKKTQETQKIVKQRPQMEHWRHLSLPANRDLAQREYYRYLEELLRTSGVEDRNLHANLPIPVKVGGNSPQAKQTLYTTLSFDARGKATLADLSRLLERFERTPLDHKIKLLTVARIEAAATAPAAEGVAGAAGAPAGAAPGGAPAGIPGRPPVGFPGRPGGGFPGRPFGGFGGGAGGFGKKRGEMLNIHLVAEAIIVEGATKQQPNLTGIDARLVELDMLIGLRRGPVGLALVPWAVGRRGPAGQKLALAATRRTYTDIGRKNIFIGAPSKVSSGKKGSGPGGAGGDDEGDELDVTPQIYMTEITLGAKQEARLFNRLTQRTTRLRLSTGYNTFVIQSELGETTVLRGKVLRIEPRDVYFAAEDAIYKVHIGANLQEALRRPLGQEEIQVLGLKTRAGP